MLSVAEISSRIHDPNMVVPEDLSTLQELSDKYPYTQFFSILYLKALSKAGDPRFEEELSRHSYRISDRVQLYYLIQDHETEESLSIPTEEPEIEVAPEPIEVSVEEAIQPKPVDPIAIGLITEEAIEETVESELAESIEENVIEELVEEIEVSTDSTSEAPQETIEETNEVQDNLDESILHNVYAANYRLDDLTEEEEKRLESKQEDPEPIVEEIAEDSTSSFTGWLHSNNNYAERDTSDKEAITAVVEGFSEFDPSSDLFGEVEKPKTEFFSPSKKAKKSLEENELPVSETLAKIYIMQGNYPQAISAYNQLSLAFPEKKIFFANLIEDLEKKINT